MMPTLSRALRRGALILRQIAALGALFLAVRILWLSAALGIAHGQTEVPSVQRPTPESSTRNQTNTIQNVHRPNLAELSSMVGKPPNEKEEAPPPPPVPILRRILVDVGPPRSEVFVGKRNVGQTPYGGQIACTLGEEIRVQVLPTRGIPIERRVVCRGDTLLVQD